MTRPFFAAAVCLTLAGIVQAAELPSRVLDLSRWKLTLPVDTQRAGRADEIQQPELNAFQSPQTFFALAKGAGVVFRASCGGATTKGSKYPRCELREMNSGGNGSADWATDDGQAHTLTASLAVTHTPDVKPQVVCAQIHDAKDDLVMIRLEGQKLFVERNKTGDIPLDDHYRLGTFFDLKIEAAGGHVRVWYNGAQKLDWQQSRTGCYFKIGCYTQSNPSKGDRPEAYGEVVVRQLKVEHMPGK